MEMEALYAKIAKKYGVSAAEVKRDMQAAIGYAHVKTSSRASVVRRQKGITFAGGKPTAEAFIICAVSSLKGKEE